MIPEIIYRDDDLVVVNKPHGLLVHRSSIARDVEVYALQLVRDMIGQRVYPVHRLDRKTSGCLIFALSKEVNADLGAQLASKEVQKVYHAIVRGYTETEDTIDYPVKDDRDRIQDAITHYKRLKTYEIPVPLGKHPTSRYSFIEVMPETGRFHQIRKHMNHLRHPILGDRPHGCSKQNRLWKNKYDMMTMMLHARSITFNHPTTKKEITLTADYSEEFVRVIGILESANLG